jgi:uncharacterized membrane protein
METNEVKKIQPTFGGSFNHGWNTMSRYFLVLLLVVIVTGLIMAPAQALKFPFSSNDFNFDRWGDWHNWGDWSPWDMNFFNTGFMALGMLAVVYGIFAIAYSLLVVPVFKFGANLIFVHAARDTRPEFETLIKGFKENYLHIVLANLLMAALIMLGFIFCIIPGIIVACRLAFVTYLVMDKKLDPIIAIEESWRMTKGYGWTIFGMAIVSFFIFIAGFAMCFVGIIPAIIWVKSSFASMYEAVLVERNGRAIVAG